MLHAVLLQALQTRDDSSVVSKTDQQTVYNSRATRLRHSGIEQLYSYQVRPYNVLCIHIYYIGGVCCRYSVERADFD